MELVPDDEGFGDRRDTRHRGAGAARDGAVQRPAPRPGRRHRVPGRRVWVQAKLDAGETLVGAKLGLTSKIKQQVMKVDSPLYGWVTSSMLAPYGEPVELATLIHP